MEKKKILNHILPHILTCTHTPSTFALSLTSSLVLRLILQGFLVGWPDGAGSHMVMQSTEELLVTDRRRGEDWRWRVYVHAGERCERTAVDSFIPPVCAEA